MASTEPTRDDTMIITKRSPRSVADTVERFKDILRTRSVKVFAVIDQSAEARGAGLQLRETTLVIFGNPLQGTPVMIASPLAALDLPLKIVVWADNEQTSVSYYAPRRAPSPSWSRPRPGPQPCRYRRADRRPRCGLEHTMPTDWYREP